MTDALRLIQTPNERVGLEKFIQETSASPVDHRLLQRFEKLTGEPPHRYLRRGMVFSHRDLDSILDRYERGEPFYLFTGRGPSSESLHLGHSIPLEFTQYETIPTHFRNHAEYPGLIGTS